MNREIYQTLRRLLREGLAESLQYRKILSQRSYNLTPYGTNSVLFRKYNAFQDFLSEIDERESEEGKGANKYLSRIFDKLVAENSFAYESKQKELSRRLVVITLTQKPQRLNFAERLARFQSWGGFNGRRAST
ncbi:hypothetical protein HYZ97_04050 [Candidatus Pacearchaeota archaeon]|nr:hypothetical protein [Candidatus Pacearchaeota archaeon]